MSKKLYLFEFSEEYFGDTGDTPNSELFNSFDKEYPIVTIVLTDEELVIFKLRYGHFVSLVKLNEYQDHL